MRLPPAHQASVQTINTDIASLGPWYISFGAFGEILPNSNNRVTLNDKERDKWGLPLAHFDCRMGDNEIKMMAAARLDAISMLEAAGCTNIVAEERDVTLPGNRIHEMGTARMGRRSTNLCTEWLVSKSRRTKSICFGWFFYGISRMPKPISNLHGICGSEQHITPPTFLPTVLSNQSDTTQPS